VVGRGRKILPIRQLAAFSHSPYIAATICRTSINGEDSGPMTERIATPDEILLSQLGVEVERVLGATARFETWLEEDELVDILEMTALGANDFLIERIREAAKCATRLADLSVQCLEQAGKLSYRFVLRSPDADLPVADLANGAGSRKPTFPIREFALPVAVEGSGNIRVHHGDNLAVLRAFAPESFDFIYIDPPFNTGREQTRRHLKIERQEDGDRVGFHGQRYRTTVLGATSYTDRFDDYMSFLAPRLEEAYRLLKPNGSFFLHLDFREVHYAKVALDQIFGRDSFINEIIWAYDYGARTMRRWAPKHDNILWYAKDPSNYCFNREEIDRIPYMAPTLVGAEKAARGKTPTDTWWHTIVGPTSHEKTGYPTQKPLGILTRIVRVHTRPGDHVLDFFAGSGSMGEAAANLGRDVTLIDQNEEAIAVMRRRFTNFKVCFVDDSEARALVGEPSPTQPSPAQPSPAQPSPAQPSPAQPSPAQPSPAQPSLVEDSI
jgi:site-specific DNA-methyltransferase (adenine-specific)